MKKILGILSASFALAAAVAIAACTTAKSYTITFDANGAEGTMDSLQMKAGDYTLPANEFTYADKEFMGYRANGEGNILAEGDTYAVSADVTFEAVWGVEVTFGGDLERDPVIVELNTAYTPAEPSAPAHTAFAGWYLSETDHSDAQKYSGTVGEDPITLYAYFTDYAVYEYYDGATLIGSKNVAYGAEGDAVLADEVKATAAEPHDYGTNKALDGWASEGGDYLFDLNGRVPTDEYNYDSPTFAASNKYKNEAYEGTVKLYAVTYDSRLSFGSADRRVADDPSVYGYYVKAADGADITGALEIPATYHNLDVFMIGTDSVSGFANKSMTSVVLPASIETIGKDAFKGCTNLATVTVKGTDPIAIGDGAFAGCTALTGLDIKVSSIGGGAFSGAFTDTAEISIDVSAALDENGAIRTIRTAGASSTDLLIKLNAFAGTGDDAPGIGGAKLTLTGGLKIVPDGKASVAGTSNVSGFFVYATVKEIEIATIEKYGDYAFAHTSYTMRDMEANSSTVFGKYAFAWSKAADTFNIMRITEIPEGFLKGSAITGVDISDVTTIGAYAFQDCASLASVHIPASVNAIGESAFAGCNGLTDPKNVTVDGGNAVFECNDSYFQYKDGSDYIIDFYPDGNVGVKTLMSGITSVADSAYKNREFTKVIIPESVETIGKSAFEGCASLATVEFRKGADGTCALTTISADAFKNCTALQNITIPYSVTTIDAAFGGSGLVTATFEGSEDKPSHIQSLTSTFKSLTSLTSVTFSEYYYLTKENILAGEKETDKDLIDDYKLGLHIAGSTFQQATNLSLVLPWYTTAIAANAFTNGNGDTKYLGALGFAEDILLATIPGKSLYGIGSFLKYEGSEWTSTDALVLPASIQTLGTSGSSVFVAKTKPLAPLKSISFASGSKLTTIGAKAFDKWVGTQDSLNVLDLSNCSQLTTLGSSSGGTIFGLTTGTYTDIKLDGSSLTTISALAYGTKASGNELTIVNGISEALKTGGFKTLINNNGSVKLGIEKITFSGITSVPENLFNACTWVKTVTLDNGTTAIGAGAFNGCAALTTVTWGSALETIGANAFNGCAALTTVGSLSGVTVYEANVFNGCAAFSLKLAATVTEIKENAFAGVQGATGVDLSDLSAKIADGSVTLDPSAIAGAKLTGLTANLIVDDTLLYFYSEGNGETLDLSGATGFTKYAPALFKGNTTVKNVTLPDSITAISESMFEGCTNLASVNLSKMVTVGANAFKGTALASADLSSATSVGANAFQSVTALTAVTFGTATGEPAPAGVTVGDYAFDGCTSLEFTADRGLERVTEIGAYAFQKAKIGIANLANATTIGNFAFNEALISALTLGNKVTTIGEEAFANNSKTNRSNTFTAVTIPASVTSIGKNAFQYASLTSVTFTEPATALAIGEGAFQSAKLGDGTEDYALVLPDKVTEIGKNAFSNGSSAKTNKIVTVTIPASVTTVGELAFAYLEQLTTVTFSSRETDVTLGKKAFGYDTALANVYVYGDGKLTCTASTSQTNGIFYSGSSSDTRGLKIHVKADYIEEYKTNAEEQLGILDANIEDTFVALEA